MNILRMLCLLLLLSLLGCKETRIVEYEIPPNNRIGDYSVKELWIENAGYSGEYCLFIKSKGEHIDSEPRIGIEGLEFQEDYIGISGDSDILTERWRIEPPFPKSFELKRKGEHLVIHKSGDLE